MAEIRWVDRDESGKIKGHYARKQDHHKDEDFVLEDAPELLAFDAEQKVTMETSKVDPLEDLKKRIEALEAKVK